MINTEEHWNKIYASKAPTEVSWYTPSLERSMAFIDQWYTNPNA